METLHCDLFMIEGRSPKKSGAVIDHIHGISVTIPVGSERSCQINVPLGAPHWVSRSRLFHGRWSKERRFGAFLAEFVFFFAHGDVTKLSTAD